MLTSEMAFGERYLKKLYLRSFSGHLAIEVVATFKTREWGAQGQKLEFVIPTHSNIPILLIK